MQTIEQLDKKIQEIKEKYKDTPNDKNYFLCKLAMSQFDDVSKFQYVMSHVSEKEVLDFGRSLQQKND